MTDFPSDFVSIICDRCGEPICSPTETNSIEEDGLVYHIACFEEMVSKE